MIAFVPTLFEAERLDVEARRAIHVRHEEDRPGVPPVNSLASRGVLRHGSLPDPPNVTISGAASATPGYIRTATAASAECAC